jgi:hypothetical protein
MPSRTIVLRATAAAAALWASLAPAAAATTGDDEPTPAALAAIGDRVAPALVRVEYRARYDKGDGPGADRWAAWRAYAAAPSSPESYESWEQLIREDRPAERGGYLVTPELVYTSDPMLHERFVASISVRFGDQVVPARPAGYPRDQAGWFLRLDRPLTAARPLAFDAARPGPYFTVTYERRDGVWSARIAALRAGVTITDEGRRFVPNAAAVLVTDRDGVPVAVTGSGNLPPDDSWKGSPSSWDLLAATEMDAALDRLRALTDSALLRVQLVFRSPRGADGAYARFGRSLMPAGADEPVATEWNGTAILADDGLLLVLANLKPKVTGRLEKIRVFLPDGAEASAAFAGTLRDWGAFLARLDRPAPGAVRFAARSILDARDRLLLSAEVGVQGESRTAYFSRERITSYFTGLRGQTFPSVSPGRDQRYAYPYGRAEAPPAANFLFDLDGALVAAPLERRERVSTDDQRFAGPTAVMVPAAILAAIIRDARSAGGAGPLLDAENRPLSEAEENRLAWLGVELQAMEPELARASGVMDQTGGGRAGGIVTYVYADSPASQAGLRVGDILLRLHVDGEPRPIDVTVADTGFDGMGDQFWQYIEEMPEEYFDRLPQPWGSAETTLTRALTDLGFGTPFRAEVFRDGRVLSFDFKVTQGPPHFDAAPRFKSDELGLTVRDLTYEVRRHFQVRPDEPGVIISKVERGTRAAVAGLKPYETIRSINDRPIASVKDLEDAVRAGGELRIDVKRMTKGRTVKIRLDAPAPVRSEPAPGGG